MSKKKIFIGVGISILILIIIGIFIFVKYKKTGQQDFSLWNENYGKELWHRLSHGDVSSVSCQKAIEAYQSQDPLNYTRSFYSFYSYNKKRCLGLDIRNFDGLDGKYAGHTDKIFDLITGDTIVSCTLDYMRKPDIISCYDTKNSWTTGESDKIMPPPFPIFVNTWSVLNTLGRD